MERSRELRGLVLAMYQDWSSGDPSFVEVISDSDDVIGIGTDPVEWWAGGRNLKAVYRKQIEELGDLTIRPGEVAAFCVGDVGWVADNPTFVFANGLVIPTRSSIVFARETGSWSIVHWHISVGVTNQEAIGMELTTSIDALADWAEEAKPDLTPSVSTEGTVTIVFTDIESSTALNERVGDEVWFGFIRHHDEVVRTKTASHGGATVKGAGDGFMLAFPSARKSIECAIAIQREVSEASTLPVRMRVGMHTGEPIRHGDDLFGRDVAYAARVGAVATGGEILVSSVVRELCAGATFDFEGPRRFEFKGFDGEQPVYAVRWTDTS